MSRRTELLTGSPGFSGFQCRTLTRHDAIVVGNLLFTSFHGTIDDENWTRGQWQQRAYYTLSRGVCERSSLLLTDGRIPVCAMVVVEYGRTRSLDLAMTHPDYRQRGLAEGLIRQCLHNLRQIGIDRLSLCVTEENSAALRLYQKLGFETLEDFYHLKVVIT